MEPTDEELMVQVQAGNESALGTLVERWRSPLFGFLQRRTGPADADDLFQETWLRVVRARRRFDPRRRFSTWLFQIANNLCRDRFRRSAVALRGRVAYAELPAAPASGPDVRLDLERRLAALPDRLREVLVLRYFRDLGEREIAELLEIPAGTVKSRLHAAVRALRGGEEPA
ncbi:MAG TPA: sigma-70 family RNA polymerase sigma factor [Myxococcota bacterium]|nr:sigma-70 family RNA polymerase sigma factor [Myxococcota bacterium]